MQDTTQLMEAREEAANRIAGALTKFVEQATSLAGQQDDFGMEWLSEQTTTILSRATVDPELNDAIKVAVEPKGGSVA